MGGIGLGTRSGEGRQLNILDAMVLIAATALGLALLGFSVGGLGVIREQVKESLDFSGPVPHNWPRWVWTIVTWYGLIVEVSFPFCASWTIAILALRVRRPRPSMRRLLRQPGTVACYSAAIFLLPALLGSICLLASSYFAFDISFDSPEWQRGLALCFIFLPSLPGSAVLSSWVTLRLVGRWRSEASWIDRVGRLLGAYWIAAILLPLWGLA